MRIGNSPADLPQHHLFKSTLNELYDYILKRQSAYYFDRDEQQALADSTAIEMRNRIYEHLATNKAALSTLMPDEWVIEQLLFCGMDDIADMLIKRGMPLPQYDSSMPAYMAQKLIDRGYKPESKDVCYAMASTHYQTAETLLLSGVDVTRTEFRKDHPTLLPNSIALQNIFRAYQHGTIEALMRAVLPHCPSAGGHPLKQTLKNIDAAREKWSQICMTDIPKTLTATDAQWFIAIGKEHELFSPGLWHYNGKAAQDLCAQLPPALRNALLHNHPWICHTQRAFPSLERVHDAVYEQSLCLPPDKEKA